MTDKTNQASKSTHVPRGGVGAPKTIHEATKSAHVTIFL